MCSEVKSMKAFAFLIPIMFLLVGCGETALNPALDLNSQQSSTGAGEGQTLFRAKGCGTCHSVDGTKRGAPTLFGLYGREIELTTGEKVTADDAYIKESILTPAAKIAKGNFADMPPFTMSEAELNALVAYIKTLKV